ncbi:MAG: imidazoleglycerol-phosphate dehydratase HisB [Ignavibacteria bacterium]|jgi:imidazoleglycerol-phosphate dehydratase/histidinol-phosphatase|nr:imidazoleglycerol-phosphate dehydratase HisB [Ignavibacteria bacterium]MCU7502017.1 imidazoleglycerol-phosphate dehydratase HisB [Ignavibacteria bacterium]MCU7516985.1 imidazoleglycerol-phosphate dehydratase HisB [Ignavibacteria bacterium]
MNKVIIDKEFFDPASPLAKGLISGLKKLSRKNLLLEVKGDKIDSGLKKILALEDVCLGRASEKADGEFHITVSDNPESKSGVITVKEGSKTSDFGQAATSLIKALRHSLKSRKTKETDITVEVFLDGEGHSEINTGVGFFDHMLEQISKHANIDLKVLVKGDLYVDEHHTVEDTGITLGTAISEALGDKIGIKRYGFFLPMDEASARCAVDLGGRTYLNFKCRFRREKVGDFPVELTEEFFRGLSSGLKANIFLRAKGKNDHHKIEALFKAFAKALNEALRMDERSEDKLPSTKGVL